MSELRANLRSEFRDEEYRQTYADESLNTHIATQIKVLREQRELTQAELAKLAGMAQPRIAVLEDVNYSAWSISTLKRLARAFDLRLSVKFETFSSLIPEIEAFSKESLQKASFENDAWFHKKEVQPVDSPILQAAIASGQDPRPAPLSTGARILSITTGMPAFPVSFGAETAAKTVSAGAQ